MKLLSQSTALALPKGGIKNEKKQAFNHFTPEQELLNYQIEEFSRFVKGVSRSRNRYNNPEHLVSTLKGHKIVVVNKSRCDYEGKFSYGYAKGRGDGFEDETVIEKFRTIFTYMPYIDNLPIILDKNCLVIDGMQRLIAAKYLPNLWITFVMYDIDLS